MILGHDTELNNFLYFPVQKVCRINAMISSTKVYIYCILWRWKVYIYCILWRWKGEWVYRGLSLGWGLNALPPALLQPILRPSQCYTIYYQVHCSQHGLISKTFLDPLSVPFFVDGPLFLYSVGPKRSGIPDLVRRIRTKVPKMVRNWALGPDLF